MLWLGMENHSWLQLRTGILNILQLNSWPVINDCTIVAVALEDTEIIEDQMIVAREATLTRSRKIMKRIKLRGFRSKQRSKTLFSMINHIKLSPCMC